MKQILDFIPLVIFFIVYKLIDIYAATQALMVATTLQLLITYAIYKEIEKTQRITFIMVLFFGGLTLYFHEDAFIKWKVTVIYSIFAIGLAISHLMGKSAIKRMLGKEIELPDAVWSKITWAWVFFFSLCALLNTYVAFNLSQDTWVNFKAFGLLAATFIYTLLTGIYIYRFLPKEQHNDKNSD